MYSKASWGGSVDPFVSTKLDKPENLGNKDALASFIIFEWHDQSLIGIEKAGTDAVGLPFVMSKNL